MGIAQSRRIVELKALLLKCASRLEDSMEIIVAECSPDEEDVENEREFIAEVRKAAATDEV